MIVLCTPSCSSLGNVQQSSPFFLQFPMCKCHHTFSGSSFTKLFSLALLYIYIFSIFNVFHVLHACWLKFQYLIHAGLTLLMLIEKLSVKSFFWFFTQLIGAFFYFMVLLDAMFIFISLCNEMLEDHFFHNRWTTEHY